MASTFTTSLRLEKIGNGEQSGSWGTTTNTQYDLVDKAISGYLSIATGDANVTLTTNNGSSDQARNAILKFTGTNTAQRDVIIPAVSKIYIVNNATTQALRVKTSGGVAVTLAAGETSTVYCDGTDCFIPNITASSTTTLTNKTINFANNTVSMTFAELNTAISDTNLGTAAQQNTGTSGANVPLLSTANTWTLGQTFSTNPIINHASEAMASYQIGGVQNAKAGITSGTFRILTYNDSGVFQGTALSINRTTLVADFAVTPTVASVPFGTAAFVATGTSGATIPLLNGANTWSAAQIVSVAGTPLTLTNSTDASNNTALIIQSDRATPANNDNVTLDFRVSDSAGNQDQIGSVRALATSVTSGAETSRLDFGTIASGTFAYRMILGTTSLTPTTSDGLALGSTTNMWSDLFLASGGVINFNNGDVTITHSANALAFAGASSGYTFDAKLTATTTAQSAFTGVSNAAPATSGTTQTGSPFRIGSGNTAVVLDMGICNTGSTYAWLQATDSGDLSLEYELRLNPNGGAVTVAGNTVLTTATGAQLGAQNTFTASQFINRAAEADESMRHTNSATSRRTHFSPGDISSQNGNLDLDAADGNNVNIQTSGSNRVVVSPTLVQVTTALQARVADSSETTGSLTTASCNKRVLCSGDVTLPSSGQNSGDIILIDPQGTARTITRPGGYTMYINNTDAATGTTGAHNVVVAVYHGGSKWTLQGSVT